MLFKHMLSGKVENVEDLTFPLLASPKLDGVRGAVQEGQLVSRNHKAIPNRHVKDLFNSVKLEGLDGELVVGDPTAEDCFRVTESGVMSEYGVPNVKFYVFDMFTGNDGRGFSKRLDLLNRVLTDYGSTAIVVLEQALIKNARELLAYEKKQLKLGYEGVMIRSIDGPYKEGRSTLKEGWLLKKKIFADAEAKIIGLEEQLANTNVATRNVVGKQERSHKKAGMVGKGTLGALIVEGINGPFKGKKFNIGTGFDDAERAAIWANPGTWLGATVKYKYFPKGSKDLPRFPVYLGPRSDL